MAGSQESSSPTVGTWGHVTPKCRRVPHPVVCARRRLQGRPHQSAGHSGSRTLLVPVLCEPTCRQGVAQQRFSCQTGLPARPRPKKNVERQMQAASACACAPQTVHVLAAVWGRLQRRYPERQKERSGVVLSNRYRSCRQVARSCCCRLAEPLHGRAPAAEGSATGEQGAQAGELGVNRQGG